MTGMTGNANATEIAVIVSKKSENGSLGWIPKSGILSGMDNEKRGIECSSISVIPTLILAYSRNEGSKHHDERTAVPRGVAAHE